MLISCSGVYYDYQMRLKNRLKKTQINNACPLWGHGNPYRWERAILIGEILDVLVMITSILCMLLLQNLITQMQLSLPTYRVF